MSEIPLNIADLVPRESVFTLSTMPNEKFTLCRWSLRVREWAVSKYSQQGIQEIFEQQKIGEVARIAYFMLKEKEKFKTLDDFLDAISSVQDQVNIYRALLDSVGIGEPEMKKIDESLKKAGAVAPTDAKKKSKLKKTGAKSLTP